MNIFEEYYCSRCMKSIALDKKCPYCGYDPEVAGKTYLLEEGTLFCDGSFELGAMYNEDDYFIRYSAWDYQKMRPVIIKEYFPKAMVYRDILYTDFISVYKDYQREFKKKVRDFCSVPELVLKKNNTIYWLEPHPSVKR